MTPETKARLIALAAFPLLLANLAPARAQTAAAAAPAATAATADVRRPHVSLVTSGDGPAVVLIPGLASPRAVWDGVLPTLTGHRVHAVQLNGFGGDEPGANLAPGLLDGAVEDLHAAVTEAKSGPVSVVGHSLGGLLGLLWAKRYPGDIARLMLVDSLPFFAATFAPPGMDLTAEMVQPRAAMLRDAMAATYGKPVDPAAIAQQTQRMAIKPASVAQVGAWAAKADPRVTAEALYEDLTTDLRGDLPAIRTPITLVHPWNARQELDRDEADAFYRRQFAGAPNVRFVEISDSGHFVMLDQPKGFATALTAFLK